MNQFLSAAYFNTPFNKRIKETIDDLQYFVLTISARDVINKIMNELVRENSIKKNLFNLYDKTQNRYFLKSKISKETSLNKIDELNLYRKM